MKFCHLLWTLLATSSLTTEAFIAPSTPKNAFALRQTSNDEISPVAELEELLSNPLLSARAARITAPLMSLLATGALTVPTAANAEGQQYPFAFDASRARYFPGSLPNSDVAQRIASTLRKREYRPYNTLVGSSLCSDEINDTPQSLATDIQKKLVDVKDGGVFNLGGLGGLPFVGTSGFGAFLSHCPNSGKIFILFGPHVGISQEGVVGKVERIGVKKPSTSCGAAVGAYKALLAGADVTATSTSSDFQEEYIIENLKKKLLPMSEMEEKGADDATAFITKKMFDLVVELMLANISTAVAKDGFWTKVSEITLLGGIVINRGHGEAARGGEDYFQPLMFKVLNEEGESDLYADVFRDLPTPVKCYTVVQG
uniref:Limiting CO2-inducible protein B/C beta carbonyic anhydrase domain-containing protein n=2 Tax=Ditylum brightwellii TaxID=49249 RepID=A0A7S4SSF1_9STRA|mmetsp:Transcript_12113/g.16169  ORF Transcript_12113/g.16169 Transcript_12113/m.16169 type:complete len:371 (+) Transcript_12113:52-1164(+)